MVCLARYCSYPPLETLSIANSLLRLLFICVVNEPFFPILWLWCCMIFELGVTLCDLPKRTAWMIYQERLAWMVQVAVAIHSGIPLDSCSLFCFTVQSTWHIHALGGVSREYEMNRISNGSLNLFT